MPRKVPEPLFQVGILNNSCDGNLSDDGASRKVRGDNRYSRRLPVHLSAGMDPDFLRKGHGSGFPRPDFNGFVAIDNEACPWLTDG